MSTTKRILLAQLRQLQIAALLAGMLACGAARAEDNVLHGPHPFLKDNALSAHVLLVEGGSETPGGAKIAADYGLRLRGPAWLDLQLNYQNARCDTGTSAGTCTVPSGTIFETLVGGKLKWATAIPLVPYAKGGVGLVYAFPDGAANGLGPALRFGGGANYFIYDWLGFGVELSYSLGHLSSVHSSYSEIDFGAGAEFQF
jgi:hypothetical protein